MIDIYVMIWHLKGLNFKTILRPSIVGGMPLKRTHVVPSLNFKCTPRDNRMECNPWVSNVLPILIWGL